MRAVLTSAAFAAPLVFGAPSAPAVASIVTFPIAGNLVNLSDPSQTADFAGTFFYDSAATPVLEVASPPGFLGIYSDDPASPFSAGISFTFRGIGYTGGLSVFVGDDSGNVPDPFNPAGVLPPTDALGLQSALLGTDGSVISVFDVLLATGDTTTFTSTALPTSLPGVAAFAALNEVYIEFKNVELGAWVGSVTVVPLPAGVLLMGSGLMLLGVYRRLSSTRPGAPQTAA